MSKISVDAVLRLAGLARIGLTPDEASQLTGDLDAIVDFVEQLQSVDISGTPPTDQVTGLVNVTREDEIRPAAQSRDELLANAPLTKDGYIVVKRVLNG